MAKEINICCGRNKPSGTGASGAIQSVILKELLKCKSKASLFENGKWWCKKHAPSKVKEREEKSWQTYLKKINKNRDLNG